MVFQKEKLNLSICVCIEVKINIFNNTLIQSKEIRTMYTINARFNN
jgi:hypothetical protein